MYLSLLKDFLLPVSSIVIAVIALIFSRRAHISSKRPHLVFSEDEIKEDSSIETGFYLRNIGLGPAFNIEIPPKYVAKYEFLKAFTEIPRNLSPNGGTLFNSKFIKADVTIEVSYEDHEGRRYQTTLKEMKHYSSDL